MEAAIHFVLLQTITIRERMVFHLPAKEGANSYSWAGFKFAPVMTECLLRLLTGAWSEWLAGGGEVRTDLDSRFVIYMQLRSTGI